MTIQIKRRKNESINHLLKRFRREVSKSGVLHEARRRRFALSKGEHRRVKRDRARRRWYKRR